MTAAPTGKKARNDRRQFWIAGLVLGLSLVVITVIVSIASNKPSTRQDTEGQLTEQGGAKPHIIPLPNSGQEPEDSGDRGGWAQLATLGAIVAGLGLVSVLVWRGTRKPSSGRQAWLAAAEEPEDPPVPPTDRSRGSGESGDGRAPPVSAGA